MDSNVIHNPPSDLRVRTFAGIGYVALIVVVLLQKSGIPFLILFSLFGVLGVMEYNHLSKRSRTRPIRIGIDALAVVWLILMGYFIATRTHGIVVWVPLIAYMLFILARSIFSDEGHEQATIGNSLFPLVYIGLPLFMATLVSFHPFSFFHDSFFSGILVLSVFVIVWINDTFAYLVGCFFGRHLLFPRLSPKKTIEGFLGGVIASMIMAGLMAIILPDIFGIAGFWRMTLYGMILAILSDIGDLFESMLKRRAGVKDSGKLIPGHGGILDRIDSFLFAMAGAFILIAPYSFP